MKGSPPSPGLEALSSIIELQNAGNNRTTYVFTFHVEDGRIYASIQRRTCRIHDILASLLEVLVKIYSRISPSERVWGYLIITKTLEGR